MRTILIVTPYYPAHGGGVEIVAGKLAAGLASNGWKVVWIASGGLDNSNSDDLWITRSVQANNTVERHSGVPFPLWGWDAMKKLWSENRTADVVMVHESLYISSMLTVLIARFFGRPVVLVQHIGTVPYKRASLKMIVRFGNKTWTRIVHLLSHQIVYISSRVMNFFEGETIRGNATLIPNGVDVSRFRMPTQLRPKESRPRILFVGRFVEKKGLDIVEALARCRADLDFFLAGNGPINPEDWNLRNVKTLGHLDASSLAEQYHIASLLLLPSHGEGFPLVVQEAMATGLAPLVSDETASGLPGVGDHVYCASVKRDTPTLIKNWSNLIDGALAAEHDGHRAQQRAEFAHKNWNWTRCITSYDRLLDLLCNTR